MPGKSPLTFSLLQFNPAWEDKKTNLLALDNLLKTIPAESQIVVLPEMFCTGYTMNTGLAEPMDGQTVSWMRDQSRHLRKILTGSVIIKESEKVFNRLIWCLPDGTIYFYDKRHLFGFAGEDNFYAPGQKQTIVQVNGWRICLRVCYDLRFPVWNRQKDPLYDVLLFVSSWPDSRILHWDTLLRARAIENQAFVIGVNRVGNDGHGIYHSGHSQIVGPLGELLIRGDNRENVFLTHTLSYRSLTDTRSRFPFLKDADDFRIL